MTGARTGHAGTLDPFATGLLLVLSGRTTKIAQWLVGLDKRYLTDVDLTARTSTGDPERAIAEALAGPCRTLRRTEVGPFSVADAVTPDAFEPSRLLPEAFVLERVG